MRKITLSDVTLKVLEEKGASLTFREKLNIASKLDSLLLDGIELPFLAKSLENEVIYRTISSSIKNATVKIPFTDGDTCSSLASACISGVVNPCLQVIIPTSTALMEYSCHKKADAMLKTAEELVLKAKELCENVELILVDCFRAEDNFIVSLSNMAFNCGVSSVTLSDDAGLALPEDYENLVKKIKASSNVKVSVMPSDALSLASACAIKAIMAGADGVVTCSANKWLSLATFAEVLKSKRFNLEVEANLDLTNVRTALLTLKETAENSLKESDSEKVSGIIEGDATLAEVSKEIKALGYELSDSDIGKVYDEFKKLTSSKETIDTKELEALIASVAMQVPSTYHLVNYVVNSGNVISATANVILEKDGQKFTGVATGDGPIDAAFNAIENIIGHHYELDDFQVHAVTKGRGAVGSSIIRLRSGGKLFPGNGVSTDIVGACIRAYVNALNKIVYEEN